jgi:hypothetical protein
MNTWEPYRDLLAPAGVLTADPDWLALQYTSPAPAPPLDKVLDFPRGIPGASVIVARNVRLCVYALSASGAVLTPGTGTVTFQVLEVVTGSTGPVLVEVDASLVLNLCADEDSGLAAYGNGDYIFRALSSANVPVGTTSYRVVKKAIG